MNILHVLKPTREKLTAFAMIIVSAATVPVIVLLILKSLSVFLLGTANLPVLRWISYVIFTVWLYVYFSDFDFSTKNSTSKPTANFLQKLKPTWGKLILALLLLVSISEVPLVIKIALTIFDQLTGKTSNRGLLLLLSFLAYAIWGYVLVCIFSVLLGSGARDATASVEGRRDGAEVPSHQLLG